MAKVKSKTKNIQNEKLSGANIITGIWVILMFSLFPLIFTNYYFNILETKFITYCILTIGLFAALLVWGMYTNRLFDYWSEAKDKYKDNNGKWFKTWFKESFNIADYCFMIFIVISTIATLLASPYISQAFTGKEGRHTGLLTLLLYVIAYFCVSRFFKFSKMYFTIFLWVGLFICYFGITDYFNMDIMGFKVRMKETQIAMFTSTLGNINTYTTYVAFVVSLAGTLFITSKEWLGRRLFYLVCLEVAFLALTTGNSDNGYLTIVAFFGLLPLVVFASRRGLRRYMLVLAMYFTNLKILDWVNVKYASTVLGIDGLYPVIANFKYINIIIATLWAITILLYVIDYRTKATEALIPKYIRYIWGGFIIISIIGMAMIIYKANTDGDVLHKQWGSLTSYLVFSDSWGTNRGYIWRACIEEYNKLPLFRKIFGTGPDTFGIYMVNNRYDDMVMATHQVYDSAHNEYLQYLFTIGPVALISYLVALVYIVINSIKAATTNIISITKDSIEPYMIAFAFLIVCYAAQASVNINLPISTPVLWVFLMIASKMIRDKKQIKEV